jgi:glycosyltransferase involved in cell wall biosynthesis
MKLLILSNNLGRASFRQRIGIYLNILRQNGTSCEVVRLPSGCLARRRLFERAGEFDGVFLQKKKLNFLDAFWLRHYARRVIYDFDDAVMYSEKNPEKPDYKRMRSFRRTAELAALVIAGNSYLAEHAKRFNTNVRILPTGLDTGAYRVHTNPKGDDNIRLVWIGSKSTLPYLAEIKPALEEIGSRFDKVVLRIICDGFLDLQNMPVEKHRWSEQTQITDLLTSDIGLAPLPDNRFARGKCGFKVLQYAAAALPVVASPVGVNAQYVHDAVTGFVVTDLSQWTDRIARLITDSDLREKMGRANQNMVHSFDISELGKGLVNLIERTLKQ